MYHNWAIDELSGDFIDSGDTGGIDCVEHVTDGVWRQAPGPLRGVPREYALWGDQTSGSLLRSMDPALTAVGFTTCTMMGVVNVISLDTEIIYPLIQVYNNNSSVFVGIRIFTTGAVQFGVVNGSAFNVGFTLTGAVVAGGKYLIHGIQRADGNGPLVDINGVDATDANGQGGGAGVDDWVDQVIGAVTATDFNIGGINNLASGGGIIQRPAIWRNTALTDIEITSLFNAIGGFDKTPDDYFEKVFDLTDGVFFNLWFTGRVGSVGRITGYQQGAREADILAGSGMTDATENAADGDLVTAFQAFKTNFGSPTNGRYQASTDRLPTFGASDTIGTVNSIVRITSAPTGIQKNFVSIGDFTADRFELSIVGTVFGFEFQFRMEINTGDFVQAVGDSLFPTLPQYMMFTVVQDGTGYLLYINGSSETFQETGGGGAVDDTSWIAQIVASASAPDQISLSAVPATSSVENWQPNDIAQTTIFRKALTAAEVSELYDSTLGMF